MNDRTTEQKMEVARARMAELATKFLVRTDADIAAMRGGLGRLASGDVNGLADIRHLAHRMVGTGATLGFESLSGHARHIEKLTEVFAPGALPDERWRMQVAAEIDALATELGSLRDS